MRHPPVRKARFDAASVTIVGADQSQYNGIFTVTAVNTTSHTFSYTMSSAPSANASGDLTAITPTATPPTLNAAISRVADVADHAGTSAGVHLEEYAYLGLGTLVAMNRPEAHEELGPIKGDANL